MILRPYQSECNQAVDDVLDNGARSTLVVMPTGCGKTVCFSHTAHDWPSGKVLIVAHREELIFQAANKIRSITGDEPEIEMAEQWAETRGLFSKTNVVVSSVQTLNSGSRCELCSGAGCEYCLDGQRRRMQRFEPEDFGLLIIDEAHHAPADTYLRMIRYFTRNKSLRVLGVTATPDRLDEEALGKVFESVAFEYGVLDAINDGWLVPIKQQWVVCENLDFSQIKTVAGDLNQGELEQVMIEEESLHQVTSPLIEIAGDRATLVFTVSVAQAELTAEILNRHKPDSAICIHGKTPQEDRRLLLKDYSRGRFQYLVGCGVFLEGFDEPRIEVVAMARPTKSRALYAQAIGRGTRPIEPPAIELTADARKLAIAQSTKPELLVLDFVGNSGRHKLICTADILGGAYPDEIVDAAVKAARQSGEAVDMTDELAKAQEAAEEKKRQAREAARRRDEEEAERQAQADKRKPVKAKSSHSATVVDPFDVFEIKARREPGWHKGRELTAKQKAYLEKCGINTNDLTFHQGSQLIGEMVERRKQGLCSYKQTKFLVKYGYPANTPAEAFETIFTAIKNNGWKQLSERIMV